MHPGARILKPPARRVDIPTEPFHIHRVLTPAAALRDIQGYAAANRVRFAKPHAFERMDQRGATVDDVIFALRTAKSCAIQDNGRWKVASADPEGDEMTIICALGDGVLVVTLF